MLPEGALWISSFYYGHIKPDKSSPTYVDDFKAQIADTENWYMRVIGINKSVGKCIKANG
ncbi:hypothetical protein [Pseudoalteromonas rubra]|uniref:Uncharacterized protein n=1 Tax=Pseudoalteromonas rubra TaxID=43658 RepID=A0A5S3X1C9_9GAMM|nr:hypothetical protein [Pseudoalteromonas rubra]TMP37320.1 hypothetical protein CWB98_11360 [Pseudoalteromonas rubra]